MRHQYRYLALVLSLAITLGAVHSRSAVPPPLSSPDVSPEDQLGPRYHGALEGTAAVSAGGNAIYSLPLVLPPGSNGMRPDIALVYNSNMRNGLLGLGWFMQGVSSQITRCRRSLAQDGHIRAVNYSPTDRFCLDGNRLLAVSGAYGESGTEYRTESDRFSRIISHGSAGAGPAWFTVETRDGRTLYYGNTTDSRNEAHTRSDVRAWALARVEDRVGNYYTVQYHESDDAREHYPVRVVYTGNDAADLRPYAEVIFSYTGRPDNDHHFSGGYEYRPLARRLAGIETYVDGVRVSDYRLSYEEVGHNQRSRLTRIERCDDLGVCQQPVQLTWQAADAGYSYYELDIGDRQGGEADVNFPRWHDFNGDGRADYVKPAYNAGSTSPYDFYLPVYSELKIALSGPDGYRSETWSLGMQVSSSDIVWVDINGDGRTDLAVGEESGGRMNYDVFISTGGGFIHQHWPGHRISSSSTGEQYYLRDMNGDGLQDLVARERTSRVSQRFVNCAGAVSTAYRSAYSWYVQLNSGSGFGSQQQWLGSTPEAAYLADFNGDGLVDVIEDTRYVHLNNGQGFDAASDWGSYGDYDCYKNKYVASFHDFNGDGLADRYRNRRIQLNTGSGFKQVGFSYNVANGNFDGAAGGDTYSRSYDAYSGTSTVRMRIAQDDTGIGMDTLFTFSGRGFNQFMQAADVNGDGIQELTIAETWQCRSGDGHGYYLAKFCETGTIRVYDVQAKNLHLLQRISTGLGKEVEFSYRAISDHSIYEKHDAARLPEVDVQDGTRVVSEIRRSNGIGGYHAISYNYAGMKYDISGRGNLGFALVVSTDVQNDIRSTTAYSQQFPHSMRPTQVTVQRLSNGQPVNKRTTTYAVHGALDSGPVFPYVARTTDHDYDLGDGRLLASTTTSNHYDDYGNITDTTVLIEDFENHSTQQLQHLSSFSIDEANWRIGQLGSRVKKFTLDGMHDPALNRQVRFRYAPATGLLEQSIEEPGTAGQLTTTLAYDSLGNVISETVSGPSLASRTSTISYDSRGRFPSSLTNPLGHRLSRTWDAGSGNKLSEADVNDQTTIWEYDSFGRQLGQTNPDGTTSRTLRYRDDSGANGMAVYYAQTTRSGSAPTRRFFDSLNRQVRVRSQGFPGSHINQDTDYDALGRAYRSSQPYFDGDSVYWNTLSFDWAGRETGLAAADPAASREMDYDGFAVTVSGPQGRSTKAHNALGQVLQVSDRLGSITRFSYDAAGNRVEVRNAVGSPQENVVTYSYDRRGRQLSETDPDHGSYRYSYNALGQRVREVSPKMALAGQAVTLQYDLLGRLTSRAEPEGTARWSYDNSANDNLGIGRLASESVAGFTRSYRYGPGNHGRLTGSSTVIDAVRYDTARSYDAFGRLATQTYPASPGAPGGFTVEYCYSATGQLERVQAPGGEAVYYQLVATDAAGRITEEWKGDGSWLSQVYDGQSGRITGQRTLNGVLTVQHFDYSYDAAGNMTARRNLHDARSERFSFDALDRLTSARVGANPSVFYDFDATGNITRKSDRGSLFEYTTSAVHAVTRITAGTASLNFSYDANGNLTGGNEAPSISWASYNKPVQVTSAAISYQFKYGPDRRRYQKQRNNVRTDYVGGSFEQIYHAGATEYRHLIRAHGKVIMLRKEQGGVISHHYIHRDHLGSVTLLTRESDGSVIESFSYDAWGLRRHAGDWVSPAAPTGEYRGYSGHEQLDDVGIIHMNGRIYAPALGRMLSPDPVVQAPDNAQHYNRYSYAYNNPLRYTDPGGYSAMEEVTVRAQNLMGTRTQGFGNPFQLASNPQTYLQAGLERRFEQAYLAAYHRELARLRTRNLAVPEQEAGDQTRVGSPPAAPGPLAAGNRQQTQFPPEKLAPGQCAANTCRAWLNDPYTPVENSGKVYFPSFEHNNFYTGESFGGIGYRSDVDVGGQAITGGAIILGSGAIGAVCVLTGGACALHAASGVAFGGLWNYALDRPVTQGALYNAAWGIVTGPVSPTLTIGGPISRAAWDVRLHGLGVVSAEIFKE